MLQYIEVEVLEICEEELDLVPSNLEFYYRIRTYAI